jgi:hypothetical protein
MYSDAYAEIMLQKQPKITPQKTNTPGCHVMQPNPAKNRGVHKGDDSSV